MKRRIFRPFRNQAGRTMPVPPLPKSRMSWSSSWRTLSGHSKMWPAACAIPLILKAATMR
ncbi:hypothetical protein [Culturomica massiliensis]|uniref:hypothetical protein n=1 Tax=Culturomica massiliensis TaxID=1841857 RepID=UPI001F1AF7D4|nr:hypothetical protein [Culturomica massiliensis]